MALQISPKPFTSGEKDWDWALLGPAWVKIDGGGATTFDRQVCAGIRSFVASALAMREREATHGTVYAARLDGRAVTEGLWHYDLGEYRRDAPTRYVGAWASDNTLIQNMFWIPGKSTIVPPNGHVVAFSEGTDRHKRRYVPERPGAVGVFVSLALYADDEPANLHCPRLAPLRDSSRRAVQAQAHAPVLRTVY